MTSRFRNQVLQSDYSSGMWRSVAPQLIPDDGCYDLINCFIDERQPIRRGGTSYRSNEAFGSDGLTWLADTYLAAGHRTIFANSDSFGVLDDDEETPVDIGGSGLTGPVVAVEVGGYMFIGGGLIYAGSRMESSYSGGSIDVTNGSTEVIGNGTSFTSNVDPGGLLQIGDERVYAIEQVVSDTQLTLKDEYQGSSDDSVSYTVRALYTIDTDDPYPAAEHYSVVSNRLCWTDGEQVRFSPLVNGLPGNHNEWDDTDYWTIPEGGRVIGLASIGPLLLIFTTGGTWTLSGIGLDIVDWDGNIQQELSVLSRDLICVDPTGIASWEQRLVVPATDGVYLIDGVSSPEPLTRTIEPYWRNWIARGYRTGNAVVHRAHYLLPIADVTGKVGTLLTCRLDFRTTEKSQSIYPWTRFDGAGSKIAALALRISTQARDPALIGAEAASTSRVVDCHYFDPSELVSSDADGSVHSMEVVSRDFGDGGLHMYRALRTRYELRGDGELRFAWSDGGRTLGGPKWDEVQWDDFKWAAPGAASFSSLSCAGDPSDGRNPHRCRVNKRRRYVRFRARSTGAVSYAAIREMEVDIRPTKATRR